MKLLVNFKGVNFSDWKWKTRNMMTQISPMIKEFFDLVDKAENDIDDEDLFFYNYENKEMLKDISKNVYYIPGAKDGRRTTCTREGMLRKAMEQQHGRSW